ncbi:MAG TPA: hypothetical protein VFZ73_00785 [Gemmatimonadaceae bacterium]
MGRDADRGGKETDGAPPAALCAGGDDALTVPRSQRALLNGAIDYAGLFPPASLGMAEAAAEFAAHRGAPGRWALGRFVLPLARWDELVSSVRSIAPGDLPWPVSVLAAPDALAQVRETGAPATELRVESVECRVNSPDEARQAARLASSGVELFVEPERLADFDQIAGMLHGTGAAAKMRTGGVTADAFPSPTEVLRFLRTCRTTGLRFKATAGLHHAVHGEYRLTYEPAPPRGEMFGFLNVAVAAALVWLDREDAIVLEVLEERSLASFEFTDETLTWKEQELTRQQLEDVRARFFAGFGSCSFREPMAELGVDSVAAA